MRTNDSISNSSFFHFNFFENEGPRLVSQAQIQLDSVSQSFVQEATNSVSLSSMILGGVAYRLTRLGALSMGLRTPLLAPILGLSAEVTTYEGSQRLLSSFVTEGRNNPNLFSWSGRGGFAEGWRDSFLNFGILKGMGHCCRTQNIFFQHFSQDLAIVGGNYATAFLGWTPRPETSLVQQLFHAEAMNLHLALGMRLAGHLMGFRITQAERGLEQRTEIHFISPLSARESVPSIMRAASTPRKRPNRRIGEAYRQLWPSHLPISLDLRRSLEKYFLKHPFASVEQAVRDLRLRVNHLLQQRGEKSLVTVSKKMPADESGRFAKVPQQETTDTQNFALPPHDLSYCEIGTLLQTYEATAEQLQLLRDLFNMDPKYHQLARLRQIYMTQEKQMQALQHFFAGLSPELRQKVADQVVQGFISGVSWGRAFSSLALWGKFLFFLKIPSLYPPQ